MNIKMLNSTDKKDINSGNKIESVAPDGAPGTGADWGPKNDDWDTW